MITAAAAITLISRHTMRAAARSSSRATYWRISMPAAPPVLGRAACRGRSRTSIRAARGPSASRARSTVGRAPAEQTYRTRACRAGRPGTAVSAAGQP